MNGQGVPVDVLYLYAESDEELMQQLDNHLAPLRDNNLIVTWHKGHITAGSSWEQELDDHLEAASLILLLVSSDFLVSDYYHTKIQRAMERHNEGTARVVPIILRPVDWQDTPFAHLSVLPTGGKAITAWRIQDCAFVNVAHGIRRIVVPSPPPPSPSSPLPPPAFPRYVVTRDTELAHFRRFQQESRAWLTIVTGLSGIGKSIFLKQIEEYYVSNHLALVLPIEFDFYVADSKFKVDRLSIMRTISHGIASYCAEATVEDFAAILQEARSDMQKAMEHEILHSNICRMWNTSTRDGLSAAIEGDIAGMKHQTQAKVFEALIRQLSTFNYEKAQVDRLIILLDGYDYDMEEDDKTWIIGTMIKTIQHQFESEHAPARCLVVMTSKARFSLEVIKDEEYCVLPLSSFTREQARTCLQEHKIKQEYFPHIYELTQMHPQFLKLVVDSYFELCNEGLNVDKPLTPENLSKRFYEKAWNEWFKRKIMKHIREEWRPVICKAAFAEYFTLWILEKALNLPKKFDYDAFKSLPYISHSRHINEYPVQTVHALVRHIIRGAEAHYGPDTLRDCKKYSRIFERWCQKWEKEHRT